MSFVLLGILNSQAAGAGGNIPASLNPDVWFDASDASTITESSGSVSQWDNKGTNANFVQATSADQPSTGIDTLNGLNVISFAVGDLMEAGTNTDWGFLHDGTTYFIAMVIKPETDGLAQIGSTTASGGANGLLLDVRSSQQLRGFVSNSSASSPIDVTDNGFFTTNAFQIVTAIVDPDNGTAANRFEHFKNGGTGSKLNTNTAAPSTGSTSSFPLRWNSSAIATQVAEYIIVSGADATESNRQEVLDYLNAKWSVF